MTLLIESLDSGVEQATSINSGIRSSNQKYLE